VKRNAEVIGLTVKFSVGGTLHKKIVMRMDTQFKRVASRGFVERLIPAKPHG
jgi:hypothetical protein